MATQPWSPVNQIAQSNLQRIENLIKSKVEVGSGDVGVGVCGCVYGCCMGWALI